MVIMKLWRKDPIYVTISSLFSRMQMKHPANLQSDSSPKQQEILATPPASCLAVYCTVL